MSAPPVWGEGYEIERALLERDFLISDDFPGDQLDVSTWLTSLHTTLAFASDVAAGSFGSMQISAAAGGVFDVFTQPLAITATMDWSLYFRVRFPNYAGWGGGNDEIDLGIGNAVPGSAGFRALYDGAHHNLLAFHGATVIDLGVAVPGATYSDLIVTRRKGRIYWGVDGKWLHDETDASGFTTAGANMANSLSAGLTLNVDAVKLWAARSGTSW